MLAAPQNAMDKMKQHEFYKHLIKEAFEIVDHEKQGYVDRKEVSYIMRYLLQFPSEAQIRDYIIEQLEGDEPSELLEDLDDEWTIAELVEGIPQENKSPMTKRKGGYTKKTDNVFSNWRNPRWVSRLIRV